MRQLSYLHIISFYIVVTIGFRLFFASSIHNWQLEFLGYAYIPLLLFNLLVPSVLSFLPPFKKGITWTNGFASKTLAKNLISSFIGLLVLAIGFDLCFSSGYDDRSWPGGGIITAFSILSLLIVHFILRKRKPTLYESTKKLGFASVVLLAISVAIFGSIFHESYPKLVNLLNAIFIVALLEEFLFRGFIQYQLLSISNKGIRIFNSELPYAIVIQGIMFGVIHVVVNAPPFEWFYGIWTIPMGILFGILTYKTGNIWLGFLIHAILGSLPILLN